jgi:hypothetical protein
MDDDDDDMANGATVVPPTLRLSPEDRMRVFVEDDRALAELVQKVHERAMSDTEGANAAGHLDLKIRERRATMWGYDSPQRFDMIAVEAQKQPDSFDKIHAVIMNLVAEAPPAQRALRARLEQMTPEAALELLGSPVPSEPGGETGPETTK